MNIFDDYINWSTEQRFGPAVPSGSLVEGKPYEPTVGDVAAGVVSKVAGGVAEDVTQRPLESAYGAVKGAAEGIVGLPGDIESLIRGIVAVANTPEGKSKLEEFIKGAESTILPTTEKVGQYVEKVLPKSNAPYAEGVGEMFAPVGTAVKGAKAMSKAIGKMAKSSKIK